MKTGAIIFPVLGFFIGLFIDWYTGVEPLLTVGYVFSFIFVVMFIVYEVNKDKYLDGS